MSDTPAPTSPVAAMAADQAARFAALATLPTPATPDPGAIVAAAPASPNTPAGPAALLPAGAFLQNGRVVRHLGGPVRERWVPLTTVVEIDGRLVGEIRTIDGQERRAIRTHRLTGRELDAFYDLPADQRAGVLPTVDATADELDALDADDCVAVRAAGLDFLPATLRSAPAPDPATSA